MKSFRGFHVCAKRKNDQNISKLRTFLLIASKCFVKVILDSFFKKKTLNILFSLSNQWFPSRMYVAKCLQIYRMDDTPLEAGLMFTCKLKTDTDFQGRTVLVRQKENGGPTKKKVCFTLDDNK